MTRCARFGSGFIVLALFACARGFAGDNYWVSPEGQAAWNNAKGVTPLPASACCSLATACANAKAGDTVCLRGGTYRYEHMFEKALCPAHSGSAGATTNWITFRNAPGEAPEIKGTVGLRQWGIAMSGNSYVKIDGIKFMFLSDMANICAGANHVEVLNCTFQDGGSFSMVETCPGGNEFTNYVSHIWVHHNVFSRLAVGGGLRDANSISEGGDGVRIGFPAGTGHAGKGPTEGKNHHITIENCLLEYAGHALLDHYGTEIVVKNNIFHNEPWYPENNGGVKPNFPATNYLNRAYNGKYSHRCYQATDCFQRDHTHNLIENNRIGHAGVNPNNDGADDFDLACPKNIVRYNSLYDAMGNGLMFKYSPGNWQGNGGISNRVYNNTIYHNGWGYPYYETGKLSVCPGKLSGIYYYHGNKNAGNVIKNNIICDTRSFFMVGRGYDIEPSTTSIIENNFTSTNGNPRFVNPDLSIPTSKSLPDLNLQPDSPAIDAGAELTHAIGAGTNATQLAVEDVLYFQDGTWGADLARNITMFPDWIAIGRTDKAVQIASIDYIRNIITLAKPMTWDPGAKIWLYRRSDGTRVLYGKAPDLGAYEHVSPSEDVSSTHVQR